MVFNDTILSTMFQLNRGGHFYFTSDNDCKLNTKKKKLNLQTE